MLKGNLTSKPGFTLVELLVVISIIGLLSSFAIVSLNVARVKARDALRKGDMAQIRTALYLYYDDNEGYPICDDANWDTGDQYFGSTPENGSDCYLNTLTTELISGARPIMMDTPRDPKNLLNEPASAGPGGSDIYLYRYISDSLGQQYTIIYHLEEDPANPRVVRGF